MSWSQLSDSVIAQQSENLFGSDCPIDTIVKTLGKDDKCVLYSNEYKLCRIKKGRVKWTIDLSDISDTDTPCIYVGPSKKNKKRIIFIVYYTGNFEEVGRKVVEYPSGKVVYTSDSK